MPHPDLIHYISQNRLQGVSDESIKEQLLKAGWSESDVREGMHAANGITYESAAGFSEKKIPSKKFRRLGIFFLLFPCSYLVFFLLIYLVFAAVFNRREVNEGFVFFTLIFGLFLAAVLILFSPMIILGIIFLRKKEKALLRVDGRSGKGKNSSIPQEIGEFNWGAAGLTLWWGVFYGVWKSLWSLLYSGIPFVNIIWMIYMGKTGNSLAWSNNEWEGVEHFKASQNKWRVWGIIFFILAVLPYPLLLLGIITQNE